MSDWLESAKRRNHATRDAGRWRRVRDLDGGGPTFKDADGRTLVSFASNDYLGLTQHPDVIAAAKAVVEDVGTGSGSARLIVGGRPIHSQLEEELADWKGKQRAVVFPSGFAANLGVLSVLGTEEVAIFSDELNHASIVDGCRMARAKTVVYPHLDTEALDKALAAGERRALVVTDSVFSMDGDCAPVEAIAGLCEKHSALLVVDEAHAVLGPDPKQASGQDVIRVGTLSKFLGSVGGFVACAEEFADLLINQARSYIFTTAGSPADAAAALAALRIVRSAEGAELRERLVANVQKVRPGHASPIVPVPLGDERLAVELSAALEQRGFLVPAIRPPSVAPGTSRLRITLSAAHTSQQVDGLINALGELVGDGAAP